MGRTAPTREPYYEDGRVTLYHGDCLEVAAWLDADVLITDPPYGINGNISSGPRGKTKPGWMPTHKRAPKWDESLDVRDAALKLWGDRPRAVFGSPRRLDGAPPFREVPLVWDKGGATGGMGDTTFPWKSVYELVYVAGGGWSGKRTPAILRHPLQPTAARDIGHPTPKPVGLMAALILKAPAGVIADPFAGSGSTLVAAQLLNRRAIGVEIDEKYCEVAARRLSQGVLDFDRKGA